MKAAFIVITLLVAMPSFGHAATMFYLVQVENGQTVSVFGNYSTLEQCLVELKKEKNRGTQGLQCQIIGESKSNSPVATDSKGLPIEWYLAGRPFGEYRDLYILGGPYTIVRCGDLKIYVTRFYPYCLKMSDIEDLKRTGMAIHW